MVYTEVPVDQLTIFLQSPDMMARCDVIALLYENERDQANFLRDVISKLPDFVPKILINTKVGFAGSQDSLARDLGGLRICHKMTNGNADRFKEA